MSLRWGRHEGGKGQAMNEGFSVLAARRLSKLPGDIPRSRDRFSKTIYSIHIQEKKRVKCKIYLSGRISKLGEDTAGSLDIELALIEEAKNG